MSSKRPEDIGNLSSKAGKTIKEMGHGEAGKGWSMVRTRHCLSRGASLICSGVHLGTTQMAQRGEEEFGYRQHPRSWDCIAPIRHFWALSALVLSPTQHCLLPTYILILSAPSHRLLLLLKSPVRIVVLPSYLQRFLLLHQYIIYFF